ncbi:uncharacterized protein LOC131942628 [Physella acuta]|uniref:uncharacterized protein LOC131942628 n=1 Tax=Physella acuta TaxID=109671 RepID=UPI0027DC97CE|nr:uncharacterized protein LOC131942628 [Physella acuta]
MGDAAAALSSATKAAASPEDVLLDGCRNLLENGTNPVFHMRAEQCGVVACLTHFSPCRLCTHGSNCRANKSLEWPSNAEQNNHTMNVVTTTDGSLRENTGCARFDASIECPSNNRESF